MTQDSVRIERFLTYPQYDWRLLSQRLALASNDAKWWK
jgi:hypothetical protein